MKCKSLKLSDYVTIRQNKYSIIQLIPIKSNRNTSTDQVAAMINKLYKSTSKLISKENKKIIINQQMKVSFYIHITKDKVQFFFIIPSIHLNKFKVKFKEIWRHIEIKEIDHLPVDLNTCSKYEVVYESDDVLSISTDKRNNDLLNANLSIVTNLQDHEEVGIFYNFIPTGEKESNYFSTKSKEKVQKYNRGYSFKKNKTLIDIITIIAKTGIIFLNDLIDSLLNMDSHNNDVFINSNKEATPSTKRKLKSDICKSQILLVSTAKTPTREEELVKTLGNTFKVIDDDNKLIINKVIKVIDIKKTLIRNIHTNKTSVQECSNFINMPSREIMQEFKMIECNKVLELKAPNCLTTGEIRIGTVKTKEHTQQVFYSSDEQLKRLGRVILGSMGSGKTHYMQNIAKDIIKSNRGLFVIDYIDKCQLANAIADITPKDKIIEINFNDPRQLQAFNFNELSFKSNDDIYYKVNIAMQKAEQMQVLMDSINDDNSKLTPRMMRYFMAGATVVYLNDPNASFKEIMNVLKKPDARAVAIDHISEDGKKLLIEEIEDLQDLDKTDKKGNIENYDSKIDGLLDRVAWLKTNLYTKLAFNKDATNNINFVEAIKENKIILIKMPETDFKSRMLRNVIATFFLNKIWIAKQINSDTHTELFMDEIHQSYNCQLLMQNILVECRKFKLTPTLSMHYIDQLTAKCKNSLLASGSSYLLLQGCDPKAFQELKTYFEKDGYTRTDLAELERYTALCLIKNEDTGYASFIARLPS